MMRKGDLWFAVYCFALGYGAAVYHAELTQLAAEAGEAVIGWATDTVLDRRDRRDRDRQLEAKLRAALSEEAGATA